MRNRNGNAGWKGDINIANYHYESCPRCVANGKDSRGDNLVVYGNGHSHCFACGFHVYPKFFQRIEAKPDVAKSLLPFDFTREVPAKAWEWLLQYGLPYTYWKEYTGYSEAFNRLIFTVGSPMAFSIGRFLGEPDKQTRKWYVWGDSHRHTEVVGEDHRSDGIVVVEDVVSMHKVGQVNTAICLFGTAFHPCHYYYLKQANKPVYLWLDKDQELNVKKKALQLESITDNPVRIISTEKDPKSLTLKEINENLQQM